MGLVDREERRALEEAILADVMPALARRRELIAWTGSEAEHRHVARIAIRYAIGRYRNPDHVDAEATAEEITPLELGAPDA